MTQFRLTPLAQSLPATVPFVGPEAQERATGRLFDARLGANESVFGPSPKARAAMAANGFQLCNRTFQIACLNQTLTHI